MKKVTVILGLMIISSMLIFNSCRKNEEVITNPTATTNVNDATDVITKSSVSFWPKIRFVKRHHGVPP